MENSFGQSECNSAVVRGYLHVLNKLEGQTKTFSEGLNSNDIEIQNEFMIKTLDQLKHCM